MTEKYPQNPKRKTTEPKERKTREKHHRKPPPKPLLILAEQGIPFPLSVNIFLFISSFYAVF